MWELGREMQFSRCQLLLLEASSWGTGDNAVTQSKGCVGSRYQTTTGEDTVVWKVSMSTVVNYSVWISDIISYL
jgi:hypothetical protein